MLALRCSSRQVVVAEEQLDGTAMSGELRGKRPRLTAQSGHALAQRVVEPLARLGLARSLAERPGLRRGHLPGVHAIVIGGKRGVLTGRLWGALPCGTPSLRLMASVDLSGIGKRFGVNRNTESVGEHCMDITTA
jgi:hypothetical protein